MKIIVANKFLIPTAVEKSLRARHRVCAYCGKKMKKYRGVIGSPKDKATIEHLNFDGPFYWDEGLNESDLVICCQSCNSSRGVKKLMEWFKAPYCVERKINERTVAKTVQIYLSSSKRSRER